MTIAALRVALLAGSLTQGGAEKQLIYMARALQARRAQVRIYSLTRGEFYEQVLERLGLPPIWIGKRRNPVARSLLLAHALRDFRPHVLQAAHFFTNLHVTLAGRLVGAQAIGALRNDTTFEVRANGFWGRRLLLGPPALLANSTAAVRNAARLGRPPEDIHVLQNVLDLDEFDRAASGKATPIRAHDDMVAAMVSRLVSVKRVERFLDAVAAARRAGCRVRGLIAGDGPERTPLERHARAHGLVPDAVTFLGRRDDVPSVLSEVDVLVVSSDHEGFPNVVLEAMAARLPVITTPAGDAAAIVRDGETGFVVPFDDPPAMAERLARLARRPDLRTTLGRAGRAEVERRYDARALGDTLLDVYRTIAARCRHARLAAVLAS